MDGGHLLRADAILSLDLGPSLIARGVRSGCVSCQSRCRFRTALLSQEEPLPLVPVLS